ncbi:PIN domain-containing protein [Nocardia barduliensis]|uniref:PIN domain-containing protein n=1 Tax=Nocardia barduliensis TaxID=2736643 RepID=UPI0028A7CAA1|nr:PIN domain-containing protein [Nocardia barduliensis]
MDRRILDEALNNLSAKRPDIPTDRLARLRTLMNDAVPDCLIYGYEPLIEGLKLPDPDDRHVLAAAIAVGAQIIVTSNLTDFPTDALEPWHIEARSPDDFLLDQIDLDDRVVWACIQQIADSRSNPPETIEDVLDALENAGLVEAVASLRSGSRDR